MPTRVLDLGVFDDGDLNVSLRAPLRLVESDHIIGERTYACLSHRWDPLSRIITTKQSTYKTHRVGIRFDDLGLVYQDTICIMRRLRIRYLWIDSLCIIQDSARDWELESRTMAMVYNRAFFTLARQCDSNTSLRCIPNKAYLVSDPSISPPIYARLSFKHLWHNDTFPLLSRGWVYQERMLSPRFVHFSDEEISWECYETVDCQCGWTPNELVRGHHNSTPKLHHAKALGLSNCTIKPDKNTLRKRWREILREYTVLSLTKSSDKLHAIQGCAEQMRERLEDSYHFGLWQDSLLQDLGWIAVNYVRARPSGQFSIPTWSWASIDSPIGYSSPIREFFGHARLAIGTAHDGPFFAQNASVLLVTSQLLPASLKLAGDIEAITVRIDDEYLTRGSKSMSSTFYADFNMHTTNCDCEAWYDVVVVRFGTEKYGDYPAQFNLVLWRYGRSIPGSGLERKTVDKHPIYQRIGIVKYSPDYYGPDPIDWSKAKTTTIAIE
jgi:hypothetical protein